MMLNTAPQSALLDSALDATQPDSLVSWGAILAGAAAAASLSLILLILGTGLGLSSVSPWSGAGIGAATLGLSAILWITLTQVLASGMGGYITGRLRSQWIGSSSDEKYFRDTAHGFLAWSIAALITAAFLTSAIGSIVGTTVQTTASAAKAVGSAASMAGGTVDKIASSPIDMGYYLDSLFRKEGVDVKMEPPSAEQVAQTGRIFANAIKIGSLPADDLRFLGQLVASRTGLAQAEAQTRITTAFVEVQTSLKNAEIAVKDAADKARKASAYAALWLFISLLTGAFFASWMATLGGRHLRN